MLAKLLSATIVGVQAFPVEVEVYVGKTFSDQGAVVVGLPDAAVRESRDRVKAAVENSGFKHPDERITISLAPADLKKEGPLFDLPIALGLLQASSQLSLDKAAHTMIIGELALDGRIRPVHGVLAVTLAAKENGKRAVIVPAGNADEAAVVQGITIYAVRNLREVTDYLEGKSALAPYHTNGANHSTGNSEKYDLDFSDVKGQEGAKRAIEIAAAGAHNLLMIGSAGSGKSMLAKRIPTIMPPLTLDEAIETTKIHSIVGLLAPGSSLVQERPFRNPHHTVSDIGLVGGSMKLTPGEVSLAHNGVLFLDELPEFRRSTLESLRQPIEDCKVTITRASGSITFPSRFMLVAAMNPSPTGNKNDVKQGRVSAADTQKYLNRISGPLLDRIDIHLEVAPLKHKELIHPTPAENSAAIRERVIRARNIQLERFKNTRSIWANAQMTTKDVRHYIPLDEESKNLLTMALTELNLSARAYDRILKVSRTIADLSGQESVSSEHISEAISYRTLDRQMWG